MCLSILNLKKKKLSFFIKVKRDVDCWSASGYSVLNPLGWDHEKMSRDRRPRFAAAAAAAAPDSSFACILHWIGSSHVPPTAFVYVRERTAHGIRGVGMRAHTIVCLLRAAMPLFMRALCTSGAPPAAEYLEQL